ncbi:MAG: hypothetical protein HKM95_03670 [Inquilinus sp.]|nr:hypothetical protein [Inquilinus sp.]
MVSIGLQQSLALAPVHGRFCGSNAGHSCARSVAIMCFSATASFSLAATTAVIGIAALRQIRHPGEILLATVPLLFASQQAIEGALWLQLSGDSDGEQVAVLAFAFLLFAKVLWPALTPLAVILIEPDRRRRRVFWVIAAFGTVLSIYLLTGLLGESPKVAIRGHSIWYSSDVDPLTWRQIPYLACTSLVPLLSSHRLIRVLGVVVLVAFLVTAYAYSAAFISVWCFFAAANSTLIYFYFKRAALAVRLSPR